MTVLSDPICTDRYGNTGIPNCTIDPKEIVGAFLLPEGKVFTAANVLTASAFITELQTLMTKEASSERAFPIFLFEALTDNSEDIVKTTLGYGNTVVTRDGKYNWAFQFVKGGMMYSKSLRKFNYARDRKVLFIDKENVVYGVDAGSGTMRGFALDYIHTKPLKLNDGAAQAQYMIEFALTDAAELNDEVVFVDLQTDAQASFPGILDVELLNIADAAATIDIKVQTLYGKVNLGDEYSTEIAAAAAWLVTKAGTPVVPDSVAWQATTEDFRITLTTPTGAHIFSLEDPATLDGLSIGGAPDASFESDTITHTF